MNSATHTALHLSIASLAIAPLAISAAAADGLRASAEIRGCTERAISGTATLVEQVTAEGDKEVTVELQVNGLSDGRHDVHIHEVAACQPCAAAGAITTRVLSGSRARTALPTPCRLRTSYRNPDHEKAIKALAEQEWPEVFLSVSVEVLPQIREYERTCTTATNAYVKPITARYLKKLAARLKSQGFVGKLYIMLSSGGITSVETAREFPVRITESGPTAAVIASQHYGRMLKIPNIFCFDMGGTTAKSCLIQNGQAGLVSTFEVGRVQRWLKRAAGCRSRCRWWI